MNYFYVNNIKINNIEKNRNIIDYLENLNVKIPHFCYHQNLSVAGNCRMCLVELKNSPKPLISCAMTITNKMEIFTDSPLVKKARENVMEFLLLNHPLDCPVCDQGGECDLQDQSMIFGTTKKRFYNYKRSVNNKNLGPIVKTVMTRCIHCTRCVRFANEIAGIENLGTFGRGNKMEIGTYVNEIFNSELSGNVIDICPVGALTSKPYSFIDRNWELKNIKSIDFSDSFSLNIQLSIKNDNTITKVLPIYNNKNITNSWISDKTRFSFDAMFSPERVFNIIVNNKNVSKLNMWSWKSIFKEIINIIYFQYHLENHFIQNLSIIILLSNFISLETLNILLLLKKKYSFISLKNIDITNKNQDLQSYFLTNSINNNLKLNSSNFCLLIGINPRFEGSILNIKLRQRFKKGNFKIYTINSFLDLTFPVNFLGSNINILKDIVEGNSFLCKHLKFAKNPLIIYNSQLFLRNNSFNLNLLLNLLTNFINLKTDNWNGINNLNSNLNEVGINFIGTLKPIRNNDFNNSTGIFFIEANCNSNNIKKCLELKLLNFIIKPDYNNKFIIEQNIISYTNLNKLLKKNFGKYCFVNLPITSFFEEKGFYLNTEGVLKKSIKVIPSLKQCKNNWQIIRKLFIYLSKIEFNNNIINYNCYNYNDTINYINLNYLTNTTYNKNLITTYNFNYQKYNVKTNNFNILTQKIFKTKTVLWIDDFYLGGKDLYTKFSKVMIECSKSLRLNNTNFQLII